MANMDGMLSSACTGIRDLLDEPAATSKLTDAYLLKVMSDGWSAVTRELNALSQRPLLVEMSYTLSTTGAVNNLLTDNLQLPATATAIRQVYFRDSSSYNQGHLVPLRKLDNFEHNVGYQIRGHQLMIKRPTGGIESTVVILYEPGGYLPLHYGTLSSSYRSSTTVTLAQATSVTGLQDTRPNAYVGGLFRVISQASTPTGYSFATGSMERIVTSWAPTTQVSTVASAFDYTDGGNWTYEIVPTADWALWRAVILWSARFIANTWTRNAQAAGITKEYVSYMRALRLTESTIDGGAADSFMSGELPGNNMRTRRGLSGRRGL